VIKNNVCWTLFFLTNLLPDEIIFRAENVLTLKKFSKPKVKRLGKESQVLKEKDLIKCMSSSACVPQVLCTFADRMYAGILLKTRLACPLSSILSSPFSESAAQFCAASVVTALEDLHKVLYLMLNLLSFFFD
jgi:hypothetical protein